VPVGRIVSGFEPFGPDSLMWRINRENVVLLGGAAAATLQVAHPVVALGVKNHSHFREDPFGRLRRTLDAVYTVAFGTVEEVEAVRVAISRRHAAVRGDGYSAFDRDAQLWVAATLIMGSTGMYQRFVGPFSANELDAFLEENRRFMEVFGLPADALPRGWPAFLDYWNRMISGPLLGSIPECGEVARGVLLPRKPWILRVGIVSALGMELIPSALAVRLGLPRSALRGPLWAVLDAVLPRVIRRLPARVRFAPKYLHARRMLETTARGGSGPRG